jgi:hypothetical protein
MPQAVLENNAGKECTDREAAKFAGLGWSGLLGVESVPRSSTDYSTGRHRGRSNRRRQLAELFDHRSRTTRSRQYEKPTDTCFVMMPFANLIGGYYETIYEPAIKKAGLTPVRADTDILRPARSSIKSGQV